MRKFYFTIFMLLLSLGSFAQTVLWASKVIEVSSEVPSVEYSSVQLLGKPNVLPSSGDNPNAWVPTRNRLEYVKVGFEKPIKIQQIAIAESNTPGTLVQVLAYDQDGKEYQLTSFTPRVLPLKGRLHRIFFELTEYEVSAIKLVFDCRKIKETVGIDAIGISDSDDPISVEVTVNEDFNKELIPIRLGPTVNTIFKEIKPLISPDEKTLFFSRRNHPGNVGGLGDEEDIWYSELDEKTGGWKEAKNIGEPLNNNGPNFISSITPDGNSILIVLGNEYKNNRMVSGVSVSRKTANGWSNPEPLNIKEFYNLSSKTDFFLANNRKTLIMSVDRRDTKGSRDLYVSFLQEDNTWSAPANMGSAINSANEETAPFLALDDRTLYFSSKGFSGFGNYDIYVTKRLDDTWLNWSEPENLGASINSADDDIFFNISASDQTAYFCRGNDDDADIYQVTLPSYQQPDLIVKVKGRVLNSKSKAPVHAKIRYERLPDGLEVGLAYSDAINGNYQIVLPAGYEYGYFADAAGYYPVSSNIDLSDIKESTEIEKDLYLVPMEVGETIVLNNIFFEYDKANLKESSFPELGRLIKLLETNSLINIEIGGHTCSLGSDQYNKTLSAKRAQSVAQYLVTQGVGESRLTSVGYGESEPIAGNETEEGRIQNRRVEFKIIANEHAQKTF